MQKLHGTGARYPATVLSGHKTRHSGYIIAALIVWIWPALLSGAELLSLLTDPALAKNHDYCEWAHGDQTQQETLPQVEAILSNTAVSASEQTRAAAVLIQAGEKVALATRTKSACKREFTKGSKLFSKALKSQRRNFKKSGQGKRSENQEIAAIQSEISRLWAEDQAARLAYLDLQTDQESGADYWAQRLSVAHATMTDFEATRFLKNTLEKFDWIDIERFGAGVSRRAWTLVQHADDHPEFQQQVLTGMESYLDNGGVSSRDYAYLWDRVAVNNSRLQRYGTQPIWECQDGQLELQPMENPAEVDERRAKMGMGPVEADLLDMARNTCR